MEVVSFEELGISSSVRIVQLEGVNYLSVRDIIMIICVKNNNDAGKVWHRLDEEHKTGLDSYLKTFQFPGQGQSSQPVITLDGALQLIMLLPGKMAKLCRVSAYSVLKRYLAGDSSLVDEIQANATSTHPMNVLARESLNVLKIKFDEAELRFKMSQVAEKSILTNMNLAEALLRGVRWLGTDPLVTFHLSEAAKKATKLYEDLYNKDYAEARLLGDVEEPEKKRIFNEELTDDEKVRG